MGRRDEDAIAGSLARAPASRGGLEDAGRHAASTTAGRAPAGGMPLDPRLLELAEGLPQGVMLIGNDWAYEYVNPAAAAALGRPAAEIIGEHVLDLHAGAESGETLDRFRRALEDRVAQHFEAPGPTRNGETGWYDYDVQPTSGGIAVLSIDITERKAADARLRASEELRRRMLEGVDAIIAYQEAAEDEVILSPQAESILGYARGAIAPFPAWEAATHPDDLPACQAAWLASEGTWDLTYRMRRADGEWIWVHDRGVRIPHDDGRGPGMFGVIVDVTEQQRAIDTLRRSEERFAELFEGVDSLLHYQCPDEGVVLLSPVGERILGYPVERLADDGFWRSLVHPDDLPSCSARWDAPGDGWSLEYRMRRADGEWIWVRDTVRRVVPEGGGARTFGVVSDITASRAAAAGQALEAQLRDRLARTIAEIREDAKANQVAELLVTQLGSIPGVGFAAVFAFANGSEARVLACHAPDGFPPLPDQHTRLTRALRDTANRGPWAQEWSASPDDGAWGRALAEHGLNAVAFGPVVHGDHADGALVIATADPALAATLMAHVGELGDFSNTASALLAGRLHAERALVETRTALREVIDARAFRPVFQAIVDLETRRVVGYEALTRFDGRERPDQRFASAWSVGLGHELELATLEAAIEASRRLPAGRWLDLNVSPGLMLASDGALGAILRSVGRPTVIEVTEHEPIDDYAAIRGAARALGPDVRLAVDDAGAGVANFGHIVELGADFVKLDISLVRGINESLGRQALVAGMRHFSRSTGCHLVAEGIETEAEAETLAALGVEYGQGYLFGRPAAIGQGHLKGAERPSSVAPCPTER